LAYSSCDCGTFQQVLSSSVIEGKRSGIDGFDSVNGSVSQRATLG
jgi:hypothetical protein